MVKTLTTLAMSYAGLVLGVFLMQRSLMYHPDRSVPSREEAGVPDMAEVALTTEDGLALRAWHKPAGARGPTVLLLHGNGGHIGHRGYKARAFIDAGFGVLLAQYRGYGGNPGAPTEEGLYADARAALAFLEGQGVRNGEVVVYGESLGSGIATQLAAEMADAGRPAAALVLEAPFSSMAEVAQHHYFYLPARWLVRDRYASAGKIGRVQAPVLVLQGTEDGVVPPVFGERLLAAAREPKAKLTFAGRGHNDLFGPEVLAGILAFLERHSHEALKNR